MTFTWRHSLLGWLILQSICLWSYADHTHSDWQSIRGNEQSQASVFLPTSASLRFWEYTYKTYHRYVPGSGVWASPALGWIDGVPLAFIGGFSQALLALDISQQKVQWLKITNGEIRATPVLGSVGGIPVIIFGSMDRTLYALDARTGATRWTHSLVPARPTLGETQITSGVWLHDRVYVGVFSYDRSLAFNEQRSWLSAIDPGTGTIQWEYVLSAGALTAPIGFSVGSKDFIAIASQKGQLEMIDVTSQRPKTLWTYQMPHEVFGSPAVLASIPTPLLFLGSKFGNLVALDARTGHEQWKLQLGNWIDNTVAVGMLGNSPTVWVGAYDYRVYALDATTGQVRWSRTLGGEVFSAPCLFPFQDQLYLAVACLDNHVYVLQAANGQVVRVYQMGKPLWDKIPKGETLWASPAAFFSSKQAIVIHGSYHGSILALPILGSTPLDVEPRSSASVWWSLFIVVLLFLGVVLPLLLFYPRAPR
jgi:outer membrane protein assembly factor BamB